MRERWRAIFLQDPRQEAVARKLWQHIQRRRGGKALLQELQKERASAKGMRWYRLTLALAQLHRLSGEKGQAFKELRGVLGQEGAPVLDSKEKASFARWFPRDRLYLWLGRWSLEAGEGAAAVEYWEKGLVVATTEKRKASLWRALGQQAMHRQDYRRALESAQALIALEPKKHEHPLMAARILRQLKRPSEAVAMLRSALQRSSARERPILWKEIAKDALQARDLKTALEAVNSARRLLSSSHWLHRELDTLELQAHRQGRTLGALRKVYEERAKKQPRRVLPMLAALALEMKDRALAIASYERLLKLDSRSPHATALMKLLIEAKRYQEAEAWLLKLRKRQPRDVDLALLLLQLYRESTPLQHDAKLIEMIQEPVGQETRFLEALLAQAPKLQLGFTLQNTIFAKYCGIQPYRAMCFSRWGKLLWKHKREKEAFQIWRRIISIQPSDPSDLYSLASLLHEHKRSEDALPLLKRVLDAQPQHHQARLLLAQITEQDEKAPTQEALASYQQILEKSEDARLRHQARQGLVKLIIRHRGRYGAWLYFASRYALEPLQSRSRQLLIAFALETRQPSVARLKLKEALALEPDEPELHHLALNIYGQGKQALYHLRRLVELEPQRFMRYLPELMELTQRFQRYEEALSLLQRLTKQWPQEIRLWRWLGQCAMHNKQGSLAQSAFQEVLQRQADDLEARFGLASLHFQQKQWKEAHTILRDAPFPSNEDTTWQTMLLHASRQLKQPFDETLRQLQQSLQHHPTPDLAMMRLLHPLAEQLHDTTERQSIRMLREKRLSTWHQYAEKTTLSLSQRWEALLLLLRLQDKRSLPTFQKLLHDQHARLRAASLVGLILIEGASAFHRIQEKEADRDAFVRMTARMTSAWLTQAFSHYLLYHACRQRTQPWLQRLLWFLLAQKPIPAHINLHFCLYQHAQENELRKETIQLLARLKPADISSIERMLHQRYAYCFIYNAIRFLREHQAVPPALRQAALQSKIQLDRLLHYCQREKLDFIDLPADG
jgi:predicted Zn-dependent protease